MAGADLERARGLRRGPAPRGGGPPPGHNGRQSILPIAAYTFLGLLYLAQGDLEPAIRLLDQGLALTRASGDQSWRRGIMTGLGAAAVLQGRLAEGRALLEEGLREDLRTG